MDHSCYMFDLVQLEEVGCNVTLEEDGLWTIAYVALPDGSAIKSPTESGNIILYSWYEPSQAVIQRLFKIGAKSEKFEDVSF